MPTQSEMWEQECEEALLPFSVEEKVEDPEEQEEGEEEEEVLQ